MNRRGFLGLSALMFLNGCISMNDSFNQTQKPFGVQLWTINKELHENFEYSIKQIAKLGFNYIETAGFIGKSPKEFRKIIEDYGMQIKACHWSMGELLTNQMQRIEDSLEVGAEYLICSSPKPLQKLAPDLDWVVAMNKIMDLEAYLKATEGLVKISDGMDKSNLKLAYHNHNFEFIKHDYNGEKLSGMDLFTKALSPEKLRLELDIGWVVAGGFDPLITMETLRDRIDLTHLKDMAPNINAPLGFYSTEIGNGIINWQEILSKANEIKVKYNMLEQESPYTSPIFKSLETSLAYLRK